MPYADNSQKNFVVQLVLGGVDFGQWAAFDGGELTSGDQTYDDWDAEQILAGKRERGEITLKKGYRREVHAVYRDLDSRAGDHVRGTGTATVSPTGDDGVSWGSPNVYRVMLRGVNPPSYEKGNNDAAEIEITIKPEANLA